MMTGLLVSSVLLAAVGLARQATRLFTIDLHFTEDELMQDLAYGFERRDC